MPGVRFPLAATLASGVLARTADGKATHLCHLLRRAVPVIVLASNGSLSVTVARNKNPADLPNAATIENKTAVAVLSGLLNMKNINWKNIATIAVVVVVGILTAPIWLPPIRGLASKIPFLGSKLS